MPNQAALWQAMLPEEAHVNFLLLHKVAAGENIRYLRLKRHLLPEKKISLKVLRFYHEIY